VTQELNFFIYYLEQFSLQRVKSNTIAQVSYTVQSLERFCEYQLDERLRELRSAIETLVNHINKIDETHSKQTLTVSAALFYSRIYNSLPRLNGVDTDNYALWSFFSYRGMTSRTSFNTSFLNEKW
jgi:hypothetical protein